VRLVAIVNPASGRGQATQAWNSLQNHLGFSAQLLVTRHRGHATELTAQAIRDGADIVVAVGGDGTINEIVNGFFDQDAPVPGDVALGILPHGTGSDLQRMLRLPVEAGRAARLIQARKPRQIDVLKVRFTLPDGQPALRYSINVTSFGMGGSVAARVGNSSKYFGGKISFAAATVRAALSFGGNVVGMQVDNGAPIELNVTNVAIGNGQYHGAGMLACPRAVIDDGFLDVTVIPFMRLSELVRNLPLLYNGRIYAHPKVRFFRGRCVRADSRQTTLVEIDGESLGRLPVEISIVPRAIRLLM
jgi:diacylglycerol kinase (ATP)